MDIRKMGLYNSASANNRLKPAETHIKEQHDTFVKTEAKMSLSETGLKTDGLTAKEASRVVFSKKTVKDLVDPFDLKTRNFSAQSATVDPETGTFFMGLVDESDRSKRSVAAFEPNGALRWEIPFDGPIYGIVPDKNKGVVVRLWDKIFSYDKDGNMNWKFALPHTTRRFPEPPVIGPDNTVYYSTEKGNRRTSPKNLSIVSIKDGKLNWVKDYESDESKNVDIRITKKGNILFTAEAKKEPGSIMDRLIGKEEKKRILVCLKPDGKEIFEKEVVSLNTNSAHPIEGPNGTIYHVSDMGKSLIAMAPEGELKWESKLDQPISRTPAIDDKANIFITTGDFRDSSGRQKTSIICIDGNDGVQKWEHTTKRVIESPPIINGDSVYMAVSENISTDEKKGYYKVNRDGSSLEFFNKTSDDGVGIRYLPDNSVFTRTDGYNGNNYMVVPMGSLKCVSPESVADTPQGGNAGTGKIEFNDDTVVIGGVKLKRGKWLGLFGQW